MQTPAVTHSSVPAISPIDSTAIIEHGESPTAIILAIAILLATLISSLTGLARVIVFLMLRQTKPHR